jgi:UDP-2,4-diacetamido-2,4,6-trideoxy-beta-L-altropyranose hydrolase
VTQDADETARALAPFSCDWLVIDHYAIDAAWQRLLARAFPQTRRLVIDDLADRPHDCDLLLDTSQPDGAERYRALVPARCQLLLGPQFALLRPQFVTARAQARPRRGEIGRVLVFFGGSDPDGLTEQTLSALAQVAPQVAVDVVLGRNMSTAQRRQVEQVCAQLGQAALHIDVADMAALMARADLALGAAGVTTWERACLGLPTLAITVAENQRGVVAAAVQRGILTWLGDAREITVEKLVQALRAAWQNPQTLAEQSRRALEWVDGEGTGRLCAAMVTSR